MNRSILSISIRACLIFAILLLAIAGPRTASAASCERDHLADARPFVLQLARTANEIKARHANPLPPMMVHIFDNFAIDHLTRDTLGRHWTDATAAQRIEYKVLFTKISLHTLAKLALGLANVSLDVGETQALNADQVLVKSKIKINRTNTTRLDWWIVYRDCQPYIANIIFEGVSLLTTKRHEVDAVVSRIGVDGLLKKLKIMARTQASEAQIAELDQVNLDKLILEAARKP